jgi:hypothetical protein
MLSVELNRKKREFLMKILSTLLTLFFAFCFAPILQADIFVWTDENGVRKFSNFSPPAKAKLFIKTPEIPSDAATNQEQIEAERLQKIKDTEKELSLLRQELEAVKKLLEESKNAAEDSREDESVEKSVYPEEPQVRAPNHLEDTYGYRSYEVYRYAYPFAGYSYSHPVHSQKSFYHKRFHHRGHKSRHVVRHHHYKKRFSKHHSGHLIKHHDNKPHFGYYKIQSHKQLFNRKHRTGHFKRNHYKGRTAVKQQVTFR